MNCEFENFWAQISIEVLLLVVYNCMAFVSTELKL